MPPAEALAEALEEWEQEVHFHEPSVDEAIQVGRAAFRMRAHDAVMFLGNASGMQG